MRALGVTRDSDRVFRDGHAPAFAAGGGSPVRVQRTNVARRYHNEDRQWAREFAELLTKHGLAEPATAA